MFRLTSLLLCTCLFLWGFVACQGAVDPSPQLISAWEATAVASRPLWPTPTPPPTITPIITQTSVITPAWDFSDIPTLEPTEVPEDAPYIQDLTGLKLSYPQDWEVLDESNSYLELRDPYFGIILRTQTDFIDSSGTATIEDRHADYVQSFFTDDYLSSLGEYEITREETIPFGLTGEGRLVQLGLPEDSEYDLTIWTVYAEQGAYVYTFVAFGGREKIAGRQKFLEAFVATADFGSERLYGFDRNNTLVLRGSSPGAASLDPAVTTGSAAGYVGLLYRGLVRLTPDLQVVPDLAEKWEVSADGTVYTFTLRTDAKFEAGRSITAKDVVYSWERAANPDTESTTVDTYLGDISGIDEVFAGRDDEISGLTVVDDQTLVVKLDGAKPYFLAKLTYPTSFIIDRQSVRAVGEWQFDAKASGPYRLVEIREDEAVIFTRNEFYHTPAGVENVVYLVARVGSSLSLFQSGEIDIVYPSNPEVEEIRRPSHPFHSQWVSGVSMCTNLIQLNNEVAPFDDIQVRRAFALATDKNNYLKVIMDNAALQANTILPPAVPGHSVELHQELQEELGFNPAAAQEALASSSYANNMPPIIIATQGDGGSDQPDLNLLVSNWEEVLGITVTIQYLDPYNFEEMIRTNPAAMVSYGWCADYPDPENFLDVLYHSESDFNIASYSNPEIDELLEQARQELDPAVRLALYQQIERLLLEDVAAIPLSTGLTDILVNSRVQGYQFSPIGIPWVDLLTIVPPTLVVGEE